MTKYHWDATAASLFYEVIQLGGDYSEFFEIFKDDLAALLTVEEPNNASRKALESKKITVSDGSTYELNADFVFAALELSAELKIDELAAAELVLYVPRFQKATGLATSVLDSARIAYYRRAEVLVSIFNYVVNVGKGLGVLFADRKERVVQVVLQSLKRVETELAEIRKSVKEMKILQPGSLATVEVRTRLNYRRNQLFRLHQRLGEVLYCVAAKDGSTDMFYQLLDHMTSSFAADDSLVLHYLPGLYRYVMAVTGLASSAAIAIHDKFNTELQDIDSLTQQPVRCTVMLLFYCFMSDWLQADGFTMEEQQANFSKYFTSIQIAVVKLIKIGALEQLMVIVSTVFPAQDLQFYDMLLLLQKHVPKLVPKQLLDMDEERTKQLQGLLSPASQLEDPRIYMESSLNLDYHEDFVLLFHAVIDKFVTVFLNNFSNILIRLCDSEEDLYLTKDSKHGLTVDDLAENAEIERFYLVMYYNYTNRNAANAHSVSLDRKAKLAGPVDINFGEFLDWGIGKTTNTLIKSSFVLVMSALISNPNNSWYIYDILNDDDDETKGPLVAKALTNGNDSLLISNKDQKLSWQTIIRAIKSHNVVFQTVYERFIQKLQNSYNQLFLPSSSIQTFQTLFLDKETANPEKGKDIEVKIEDLDVSEEELIELSSYFKLICSCPLQEAFYQNGFELLDVLFTFLNNLTNIASLKSTFGGGNVKSETFLIGLVLNVIKSLVPTNEANQTVKHQIWRKLDEWLFKNKLSAVNNRETKSPSFKSFFHNIFLEYNDVLGFVSLFEVLLESNPEFQDKEASTKDKPFGVPYPMNLGSEYRKAGLWVYYDYIFTEIFVYLDAEGMEVSKKNRLLVSILGIMQKSFEYFSPLIGLCMSDTNMNDIVEGKDFLQYVKENPCSIVMNYIYSKQVMKMLFECCSIGNDEIVDKSADSFDVQIVSMSLSILHKVLIFEPTYVNVVIPIIKQEQQSGSTRNLFYLPQDIGIHGIQLFYNAWTFNLSVVGHLGLYVGSTNTSISGVSLDLLSLLSKSPQFNSVNGLVIHQNRLLTVVETIDESTRIRLAFIDQFVSDSSIDMKIKLLNFLNDNLDTFSISHFLLGFEMSTSKPTLGDKTLLGSVNSEKSLLKVLLDTLQVCLEQNSSASINYPSIRFSSLILSIIIRLCKDSATGHLTLHFLHTYCNLYENLINAEPLVGLETSFSGEKFRHIMDKSTGIGTLISFFRHRTLLLQFLTMEFHRVATRGSLLKLDHVTKLLVNGDLQDLTTQNSPIYGFLDILNFNIHQFPTIKLNYFKNFNFSQALKLSESCSDPIYDTDMLDFALNIKVKQIGATQDVLLEKDTVKQFIINSQAYKDFKMEQLKCLHSWVQLVQLILLNEHLNERTKLDFSLQIFQLVIPKINIYYDYDIKFAKELVSLCIILFDSYTNKSTTKGTKGAKSNSTPPYERLYPLFQTCMDGILNKSLDTSLRSDLYSLINKYLLWVIDDSLFFNKLLQTIKPNIDNIMRVLCNDIDSGDDSNRVTALILLESLCRLTYKINFVVDYIIQNNFLLLLLRSIKRTDNLLSFSPNNLQPISLDALLYELTAFKATLYFLIRMAQTKQGSNHLLQCDVLKLVSELKLLTIDPDMGLSLLLDEHIINTNSFVTINLSLDNPLALGGKPSSTKIALFELFVPIFQLVTAILVSMGPSNKQLINSVKSLLESHGKLFIGVLKREKLLQLENVSASLKKDDISYIGLQKLSELFLLLSSLTNYKGAY